jgi:hypothetical protein
MQIKLNCGVDEIFFGMTEQKIVSMIGVPDKVVIDTKGSRDLVYFLQKLILKIEPNGRLGWIEVHNRNATWLGQSPWRLNKISLLEKLCDELKDSFEMEDYGRMEAYSYKKTWLELQFEFGELYSFNFGVGYDENDQPIWPM